MHLLPFLLDRAGDEAEDVLQVVHTHDATPPGQRPRLHYPDVPRSIHVQLGTVHLDLRGGGRGISSRGGGRGTSSSVISGG